MRLRRRVGLLLAAALLAGCRGGGLSPEPVPLDRVSCARCGMLVSELRDAAEAVAAGQETRFYDDLGCLATDKALRGGVWRLYVRASEADRWILAEEASYAQPAGERTPMGYGFRAYASRAAAAARDRGGRARTWSELVSELGAGK